MLKSAAITGWGAYLPERVVTNDELTRRLTTSSDEWIRTRTGIRERRIAAPNETTSSMCTLAGQRALARAGLEPKDLDLVICSTTSPDYLLPATACLVQRKIGAENAGAFDVNAACCGFLAALSVGAQFVQCGTCERVLVTAGETLSRFLDWDDRNTCVLFGDGASSVVLEPTFQDAGLLSTVLGSRGDTERLLTIEAGGCAVPLSNETIAEGKQFVRMRGNEIFKLAVRSMRDAACEALERAKLDLEDVSKIIPHQANLRIITAMQEALGIPDEKVLLNLERYGNTGAASVGITLSEYLDTDQARPGDNLLLVAFGGGLTWASSALRWADVPAVIAERKQSPRFRPAAQQSAALS